MLLAGSIFLLTLVLVIWQPRGLSIGWSASIGAVLALVTGVIHIADIPVVWEYRLERDSGFYCGHYHQPTAR